jgi:hypothetical protein
MFLFKSKIPVVRNVIFENDDNTVTIIHSDGASKFNKEDVLESHFSCDFHSAQPEWYLRDLSEIVVFVWLLFLGGWLNTLMSIFPIFMWDEGFGKLNPQNLTNIPFLNSIIIFISSAILATLTFRLFNYFFKFLLSKYYKDYQPVGVNFKDIFNVSLNNFTLKVRFLEDDYYSYKLMVEKGYLKTNISSSETGAKNLIKTLFYSDVKYIILLFTCLIVFYLSWDKPYLAWQGIEYLNGPNQSNFILNHKNTFLYWNYFTDVNPIIAFVDGMLGVICNFIGLIFFLTLFGWVLGPITIYEEVGIFFKNVIIKFIITAVLTILIFILCFFLIGVSTAYMKLSMFSLFWLTISFCIVSAVYHLVRYLIRKSKNTIDF